MTPSDKTKRRLRVLTIIDLITPMGGAERIAQQIAMALDRERFEPAICVTRFDQCDSHEGVLEELKRTGVELVGLKRRGPLDLRPWRDLTAFMRGWEVDVIHSHKGGSSFWSALLAPRVGSPILVAHEHGWSFEDHTLRRLIDRSFIARRADALVAVTESDRRRMIEADRLPADKIRVIHNGIVTPPEPDPDADVRHELGIGPDQPVVGIVATLRREKALDILIRAADVLKREFPNIRVLIAGAQTRQSPREPRELERLIMELDVAEQVVMLGARSDIPEFLAAVDVAALCSSHEASPLSVMEYMEAAKPVVATAVGGLPDLVEDGVTGLLIKPSDPYSLAAAIGSLLKDPERAATMGAAGRERRRREFSIEATTRCCEGLYEELYAARSVAG
jgi:glycosyltransferase involved in cell wall biosynthesis